MGPTLKKDYPQVEQYVRFRGYGGFLVKRVKFSLIDAMFFT
jgi:hypothetical protein